MFYNSFFGTNPHEFVPYSSEYWLILLFFATLGASVLAFAKRQTEATQWRIGQVISWVLVATFSGYMLLKYWLGTFQAAEDLPFHLCNTSVFLSPLLMHTRSRALFYVLFCWILSGTLQGILTPNIYESMLHFNAVRYWTIHCGLVFEMVYCVAILRQRMTIRGAGIAFLAIQLYALLVFPTNYLLGANYGFLNKKPAHASLFDVLGDYPYYLLSLEGVAIVLFLLCALPFLFFTKNKNR
jgi:hypothetical integral membrane protein (TIGR02206 family)